MKRLALIAIYLTLGLLTLASANATVAAVQAHDWLMAGLLAVVTIFLLLACAGMGRDPVPADGDHA